MAPRRHLLALLLAASIGVAGAPGCAGRSVIAVTVDSDEPIEGVMRLDVTAESGAEVAYAFFVPSGAPATIPPRQTFNLVLEPDRTGAIVITVEARGAEGYPLAEGDARSEAVPGDRRDATVKLTPF